MPATITPISSFIKVVEPLGENDKLLQQDLKVIEVFAKATEKNTIWFDKNGFVHVRRNWEHSEGVGQWLLGYLHELLSGKSYSQEEKLAKVGTKLETVLPKLSQLLDPNPVEAFKQLKTMEADLDKLGKLGVKKLEFDKAKADWFLRLAPLDFVHSNPTLCIEVIESFIPNADDAMMKHIARLLCSLERADGVDKEKLETAEKKCPQEFLLEAALEFRVITQSPFLNSAADLLKVSGTSLFGIMLTTALENDAYLYLEDLPCIANMDAVNSIAPLCEIENVLEAYLIKTPEDFTAQKLKNKISKALDNRYKQSIKFLPEQAIHALAVRELANKKVVCLELLLPEIKDEFLKEQVSAALDQNEFIDILQFKEMERMQADFLAAAKRDPDALQYLAREYLRQKDSTNDIDIADNLVRKLMIYQYVFFHDEELSKQCSGLIDEITAALDGQVSDFTTPDQIKVFRDELLVELAMCSKRL